MILFTILLFALVIVAVTTLIPILIGGAGFIIVFGDVIVCALFIIWIVKRLIKKRK